MLTNKISSLTKNYEKAISIRCKKYYKKLEFTKKIVDSLYTLIAGVVGENAVVNKIKELSGNYY
jgi:hypothetical protein